MEISQKQAGKPITIWIRGNTLARLDTLAHTLQLSRSHLIENMLAVGLEEMEAMEKVGVVAVARAIQRLADKYREGLRDLERQTA